MRLTLIAFTALLASPAAAVEAERTSLEVSAPVPAELDGCLDRAVKELGMSARRVEKERRWNIGPQFLHPSVVKGGTLTVEYRARGGQTLVVVEASWPGARKEPAVQAELQERVRGMVSKLVQICGVLKPELACRVAAAGAAPAACEPP